MSTILRLSLPEAEPIQKALEESKACRVFNMECIDIRASGGQYYVTNPFGEVVLEENDEILLQGIALKVSLIRKAERLFDHEWELSDKESMDFKNKDQRVDAFSTQSLPESRELHPLDFLLRSKTDKRKYDE